MRLASFSCLLFVVVGLADASDTNFPWSAVPAARFATSLDPSHADYFLDTPLAPRPVFRSRTRQCDQSFLPRPTFRCQFISHFVRLSMPPLVIRISPESPGNFPRASAKPESRNDRRAIPPRESDTEYPLEKPLVLESHNPVPGALVFTMPTSTTARC